MGRRALLQQGALLRSPRLLRDEAIYFEVKGKDSGIVRFTFEMVESLKVVVEEENAASSE
jgi:hypothetical protein